MILRPLYMEKLRTFRDVQVVKILAGIRRSGKSTILKMLKDDLLANGVSRDHIIEARYSSEIWDRGMSDKEMYQSIRAQIQDQERYYLLLDEVQEVEHWERAVNSLLEDCHTDIYITGSNSRLMASEISTYLTGRYVLIPVFPLSYKEHLDFKGDLVERRDQQLQSYLKTGGFPLLALNDFDTKTAYQVVEGIYSSIVQGDIVRRHQVTNIELFERVMKYVLDNLGKTFSAHAIVKFLKNEKRPLSVEAIYNYLSYLEQAFIIYRCPRLDLQGKAILKTQEKFYLADIALKYAKLGYDPRSLAASLENIVYLELLRRDYSVYIGKMGTREIDFVAERQDQRIYIQVCRELPEQSQREVANLLEIKDNHPKYIVTLDPWSAGDVDGIQILHLADFLLI